MKKLALLLSLLHVAWADDFFMATEEVNLDKFRDSEVNRKYAEVCDNHGIGIDVELITIKTNRPALNEQLAKNISSEESLIKSFSDELLEDLKDRKNFQNEDGSSSVSRCSYANHQRLSYRGRHGGLEMFQLSFSEYAGGAHGMYGDSFFLFDKDARQIKLADLLASPDKDREVLRLLFIKERLREKGNEKINGGKYGEENLSAAEIAQLRAAPIDEKQLAAAKDKLLNENIYFNEQGLVFSYPPYALGSFAEGQIEYLLPYGQLKGLLKEEYLAH